MVTAISMVGRGDHSHLHPLAEFYASTEHPLPPIEAIEALNIPEPYRDLLVHERDMTPTLERFHGGTIHLRLMRRYQDADSYFRQVVLTLDETLQPVEFGAIKINLLLFQPEARDLILQGHLPLGTILQRFTVPHSSRPTAFLKIESDQLINSALQLDGHPTLYGRRNTLLDPQEQPLAEIVEILPPAGDSSKGRD